MPLGIRKDDGHAPKLPMLIAIVVLVGAGLTAMFAWGSIRADTIAADDAARG